MKVLHSEFYIQCAAIYMQILLYQQALAAHVLELS